jgi:hypothetical protein
VVTDVRVVASVVWLASHFSPYCWKVIRPAAGSTNVAGSQLPATASADGTP